MNKSGYALSCLLSGVVMCASADAYEFRTRVVRMVGDAAIPLLQVEDGCWSLTGAVPGEAVRLRLQMGVFDDATSAAPAGGVVGWDLGTITAPCGTNTRTPGRVGPFRPPIGNGPPPGNGTPSADPFTSLTGISAIFGAQVHLWQCHSRGAAGPLPAVLVYGRNEFASVYELTHVVDADPNCCAIEFGGRRHAATAWLVGTSTPPDCAGPGPWDDVPGWVAYSAVEVVPEWFSACVRICGTALTGDWNRDGVITSQDFFGFVVSFFRGEADVNDDGTTTSQDFFEFIYCFFQSC